MSASSKTEDTRAHHEVSGNNSDPEGKRTFSCLNIKLNFGKGTSVTENSTATKETLRLHHLYNSTPCPVTSPLPRSKGESGLDDAGFYICGLLNNTSFSQASVLQLYKLHF